MGSFISPGEKIFGVGKPWRIVKVDVWRCGRGNSGHSSSVESLDDVSVVGGILVGWRRTRTTMGL